MTNPTLAADIQSAADWIDPPDAVIKCPLHMRELAARLRAALPATEGVEAAGNAEAWLQDIVGVLMAMDQADREQGVKHQWKACIRTGQAAVLGLRSILHAPRPQMTEAVKVPHDMKEWPNAKQAEKSYVCGWNDCCKEVLRLNGVKS